VIGTLEPRRVGRVSWYTRIHTVPEAAAAVAAALARRDETAWIGLFSGGTEIVCAVHTRSDAHRVELLLGKLPSTPQVVSISAHYVLHEFTVPDSPKAWLQALSGGQVSALTIGPTIDPSQLGYDVSARLWLTVAPASLAGVGATVAADPNVPFAAATTGPSNLTAAIWFPDIDALYRYLTDRVGGLPGVHQVETAPTVRTVKRAG
jgi:hypothetical protein